MKRIVAAVTAFLLVFTLAACSPGSTDDTAETTPQGSGAAADASDTVEKDTTAEPATGDASAKTGENEFSELVVVDNGKCAIRITRIDPDSIWGYTLKANLENKSDDKTYMISIISASVNGVDFDPFFAAEVAPGKKANDDIGFSSGTLDKYGIDKFTDIEMTFKVYDSDDWMAEPVALETVHVYPLGEDKAVKFERESRQTDTVLFDDGNVSVIVTGYTDDSIWGYTVNLYLVNKTDKTLMYSVDEASVNGYMADPFWSKELQPGKVAFSDISWPDTTFEENNITEVEEIKMTFRVYDSNNWAADKLIEETVILKP